MRKFIAPGSGCAGTYLELGALVAAETVMFAATVIDDATVSVALLLWSPAVITVMPLENVWELASAEVNS